jgi:hypothetical protein
VPSSFTPVRLERRVVRDPVRRSREGACHSSAPHQKLSDLRSFLCPPLESTRSTWTPRRPPSRSDSRRTDLEARSRPRRPSLSDATSSRARDSPLPRRNPSTPRSGTTSRTSRILTSSRRRQATPRRSTVASSTRSRSEEVLLSSRSMRSRTGER